MKQLQLSDRQSS